jgi:uncharacterized repeat protein (TIGR03803 family)
VADRAGNLYGVTLYGGAFNWGTVYKVDPTGNEAVLYSFQGNADGALPVAGLILDAAGTLYGTAIGGGSAPGHSGKGVVFTLDSNGAETVLHTFAGPDGSNPVTRLLCDHTNLYGTTQVGGDFNFGAVFEMTGACSSAW